jgi:hypothetical protein
VDNARGWLKLDAKLNQTVMKAHGIESQLSHGSQGISGVRRGGMRSYNITTHSTEARVSLPFIRED